MQAPRRADEIRDGLPVRCHSVQRGEDWCLIEHDELVRILGETTPFLDSPSWRQNRAYSPPHPAKRLPAALEAYRISRAGSVVAPTLHR